MKSLSRSVLLMLLLLLVASMAMATAVIIPSGNPSTSSSRYPTGLYYGWENTASLYTSAEVSATGGTINTVAWYATATFSGDNIATKPLKIYMKATTDATIPAGTFSTLITGATLVYDGTGHSTTASTWNTFTLSTPFALPAGSNLYIFTKTNFGSGGGSSSSGAGNRYYTSASKFGYNQNDSGDPAGNALSIGGNRPNVQLDVTTVVLPWAYSVSSPTGQEGAAGSTLTYTFTINNIGSNADNYTVGLSGNTWTSALFQSDGVTPLSAPISIAGGANSTFKMNVTISGTALFNSTDTTTVTITPAGTGLSASTRKIGSKCNLENTVSGLPFTQNFSGTQFPPSGWSVQNPNGDAYQWVRYTGTNAGDGMARINTYSEPSGYIDYLWTPTFDMGGFAAANFRFQRSFSSASDRLIVAYTVGSDPTLHEIFNATSTVLQGSTVGAGGTSPGTALADTTISLPAGALQNQVKFVFKAVSAYGNDIFVDGISIYQVIPYAMEATRVTANSSCVAGSSVWYTVNIHNIGSTDDVYHLETSGLWYYDIADVIDGGPIADIPVMAGATTPVYVKATPKNEALANSTDAFTLSITSNGDPAVHTTVSGTTTVTPGLTVTFENSKRGATGTDIYYTFTVRNVGSNPNVFSMEFSNAPSWTTTICDAMGNPVGDTGPIEPAATFSGRVYVSIPSSVSPWSPDNFVFHAFSPDLAANSVSVSRFTGVNYTYPYVATSLATSGPAPTYSYVDPVTAGHTEIPYVLNFGSEDDGAYKYGLGESFNYAGLNYDSAKIGTNGEIYFVATSYSSMNEGISVWNRDQGGATGSRPTTAKIYTHYDATAHTTTITWYNWLNYNWVAGSEHKYQVILNHADHSITLNYALIPASEMTATYGINKGIGLVLGATANTSIMNIVTAGSATINPEYGGGTVVNGVTIKIYGVAPNPYGYTPGDAALDVARDAQLSWTAPGQSSFDVAFGTSSSPSIVASGLTGTTYNPGLMGFSQTYYWKVYHHRTDGSTVESPEMSFTSVSAAVPDAPTAGAIDPASITNHSMVVSWTDNSISETDFYGYTSTTPFAVDFAPHTATPAFIIPSNNAAGIGDVYTDTLSGLSPDAVSYVRVYAVNNTGSRLLRKSVIVSDELSSITATTTRVSAKSLVNTGSAQIMTGSLHFSASFVAVSAYTLANAAGHLTAHQTGYTTATVDGIGVDGNPATTNYRVLINGVYAGGALTPTTLSRAAWAAHGLTGLLSGSANALVPVAVNHDLIEAPSADTTIVTTPDPERSNPDGYGYRFITNRNAHGFAYAEVPLTSPTTAPFVAASTYSVGDEGRAIIYMDGFHFPFYGNIYDSLTLSTNYFIGLGAHANTGNSWTAGSLPNVGMLGFGPAISLLWCDGEVGLATTCAITYQNFGNKFVINYKDVTPYGNAAALANFQVILYSDGRIQVMYRHVASGWSPTIGIQGATTGTNFLQYMTSGSIPSDNLALTYYQSWYQSTASVPPQPVAGIGSLPLPTVGVHAGIVFNTPLAGNAGDNGNPPFISTNHISNNVPNSDNTFGHAPGWVDGDVIASGIAAAAPIGQITQINSNVPDGSLDACLTFDVPVGVDPSTVRVIYRTGYSGPWLIIPNVAPYSYSFNMIDNTVTVCGITHFSQWSLAGNNDLLPVTLSTFTATGADNRIVLNWKTESEVDNDFFRIYRSTSSEATGEVIAEIRANGSISTGSTYRFVDVRTTNGTTYYYRISDVSLDGVETTHPLVRTATPTSGAIGVLPTEYALQQNWPNPFNPTTEIRYALKEAGKVEVKVFDANGREVVTLVNAYQPRNAYSVSFDGTKLANGVYFYQIRVNDFYSVRKMVLVK